MKQSWSQFFVYAVSLLISLVLNLYRPDVLSVLCSPMQVRGNSQPDPSLDRYLNPSDVPSTHQVK
jgi:hypothetical protein